MCVGRCGDVRIPLGFYRNAPAYAQSRQVIEHRIDHQLTTPVVHSDLESNLTSFHDVTAWNHPLLAIHFLINNGLMLSQFTVAKTQDQIAILVYLNLFRAFER